MRDALEPSTTRLNSEPPALVGLTYSELTMTSVVAGACWLLLLPLLIFMLGSMWLFAPLLTLVGAVLSIKYMAGWLRRVKRNRPDRYYLHKSRLLVARYFPATAKGIVRRSGWWTTGRSVPRPVTARSRQPKQ